MESTLIQPMGESHLTLVWLPCSFMCFCKLYYMSSHPGRDHVFILECSSMLRARCIPDPAAASRFSEVLRGDIPALQLELWEEPSAAPILVLSRGSWLLSPVNYCSHGEPPWVGELPKQCSRRDRWGSCAVILFLLFENFTVIVVEINWWNLENLVLISPWIIKNIPKTIQDSLIHLG